jgi:hypothetical protein
MRKALIAAAVAAALFAVGAFAASFAVDSEDIASGNDQVSACAPKVTVDFDAPTYSATTHAWTVSGATVKFFSNATPAVAVSTCAGGDLTLKVSTTSNGEAATGTVTDMPAGSVSAHVDFTATAVKDINGTAVLVDDIFLTPTSIP